MENITIATSVLALAVSMFVAGWTVYRDLNNRGKLTIQLNYGFASSDMDKAIRSGKEPAPSVVIRITNSGNQPSSVMRLCVLMNDGAAMYWETRYLPRLLQPSEHTIEKVEPRMVFHDSASTIIAEDSYGKIYKLKKSVFDAEKRKYEKRNGAPPKI